MIELALTADTSSPLDPFYYGTLTAEQTAIAAGTYEYVLVDGDERVLLSGPAQIVDHTRPGT